MFILFIVNTAFQNWFHYDRYLLYSIELQTGYYSFLFSFQGFNEKNGEPYRFPGIYFTVKRDATENKNGKSSKKYEFSVKFSAREIKMIEAALQQIRDANPHLNLMWVGSYWTWLKTRQKQTTFLFKIFKRPAIQTKKCLFVIVNILKKKAKNNWFLEKIKCECVLMNIQMIIKAKSFMK